jgi:two-component system sensor histidine kinase DctS
MFSLAALRESVAAVGGRSFWPGVWILGFLMLVLGSVVALVLYLQHFEAEEDVRRQAADTQWLEQSVQFHFRRLEEDLRAAARESADVQGGLLWREPGVLLAQGWVGAPARARPERWDADEALHPLNVQALGVMNDTARGLRRSAYGGPMRDANGVLQPVVWLAAPYFERGEFIGNYVAALSLDTAVQALVPGWFSRAHSMRLVLEEGVNPVPQDARRPFRAAMNLAGTDVYLEVTPTQDLPVTVPRIFLLVAMVFLSGMLVSLWALRRDIQKRQRVQTRLQAEVALRTAMENSVTIGLRAWDLSGRVLYVNDAFCRLVGYPSESLLGVAAPMPYWPRGNDSHIEQVHRDILAHGTHSDGVEVQFQHRDGHLLDVLIHEAPLHTDTGEHIGWMSSVLDISERKRAQAVALQQQERLEATGRLVAVGEVASTLAHELNQPLGALSSFATGLLNRLKSGRISPEEAVPVVQRIAGLAERAGRVIQRVNAIARRREISLQLLDLVPVLQSMAPHAVPDAPSVWVKADELLIEHLLNNLLTNAQEAAQAHSDPAQLHVGLVVEDGWAKLSVSDNGPGVPEENQAHIFDAFYSSKDGGMGMGLPICRSIVEAHHGHIVVDRSPELGGARFTVSLPLAAQ